MIVNLILNHCNSQNIVRICFVIVALLKSIFRSIGLIMLL